MLISFHWVFDLVHFIWLKTVSLVVIALFARLPVTNVFALTEACESNLPMCFTLVHHICYSAGSLII